ncbi:late histone H2A.1-like [Platysternon megacephalum]|uniref:Late histone H2A.1-like n=1 Tax=Platysternon megacephalum TaxID=55544 RepID=A0A4D9DWZ2_9SAUR|nr:late histone H2A.1-like [Platysternon megacephalum]
MVLRGNSPWGQVRVGVIARLWASPSPPPEGSAPGDSIASPSVSACSRPPRPLLPACGASANVDRGVLVLLWLQGGDLSCAAAPGTRTEELQRWQSHAASPTLLAFAF